MLKALNDLPDEYICARIHLHNLGQAFNNRNFIGNYVTI